MHQSYFLNPAAAALASSQVSNPNKAFQKFANLFPNVNSSVMAAAVSSLNPFSIESLLASSSSSSSSLAVHQQQSSSPNPSAKLTSAAVNSYSPIPPPTIPSDLYGKHPVQPCH